MSPRPDSRPLAPGTDAKIAALLALGLELQTLAAHAEVSESTLRRVRGGRPVVRAVARSIELAVDDLTRRHAAPGGAPVVAPTPRPPPNVCTPAAKLRASAQCGRRAG